MQRMKLTSQWPFGLQGQRFEALVVEPEVFSDAYSGFYACAAERYVERFTVMTSCSEKLVITHNVSLRISEKTSAPVFFDQAWPVALPTYDIIIGLRRSASTMV